MNVNVIILLVCFPLVFAVPAIKEDDEDDAVVVKDGDDQGDDEVYRELYREGDCQSPPETGLCRAAFTKWYYDPSSGTCKTFTYGGCGGNQNNYESEKLCLRACANREPKNPFDGMYPERPENDGYTDVDDRENEIDVGGDPPAGGVCSLQADTGLCRARFVNWFFNADTQQCETFIYGGCGGNENNFETEEQCQQTCGSSAGAPAVTLHLVLGCIVVLHAGWR